MLLPLLVPCALSAQDVRLRAPLTTTVEVAGAPAGDRVLAATVVVPADAPSDLGIGAYLRDREGHWLQSSQEVHLGPGRHVLSFALTDAARLRAEPTPATARADDLATSDRAGLFLWSQQASAVTVVVEDLTVSSSPSRADLVPRLLDLRIDGVVEGVSRTRTGQRWTARMLPQPFPANPYDPAEFALDGVITEPDGSERRIPACWCIPMRSADRGDGEVVEPDGSGSFALRFRPAAPGCYQVRLEASWHGAAPVVTTLPDLVVDGAEVDDVVSVDRADPRFFSVGGAFWWPIGINLHSPFDTRSRDVLETTLTPPRGTLVYEAMFARVAAAGIDACEVWMAPWNLALEWRGDWPGYHGIGRYSQVNAWRLDRVLDLAWAHGIRVNLVLSNHGQASPKADRQWKDNPYNQALGGPLATPAELFSDPGVAAMQERLRRYIVARYADHPAILGWKLWSEVDLTAGRGEPLVRWHEQAAARWRALDGYGHPVTTHWSGDYRTPNREVCALPGIDYLCIDAYRGGKLGAWSPLAELLIDTTTDRKRGLQVFAKPVLVTEYGAGSSKSPIGVRSVDQRTGAWSSLIAGHAGAAMLWWWEWVDQTGRWQPYRAIRAFVAGEDLRGSQAHSVQFPASVSGPPPQLLIACGWTRSGRILGYVQDPRWGAAGGDPLMIAGATLTVGEAVPADEMIVDWWDADAGAIVASDAIDHPGGPLVLSLPTFAGHLAFKLARNAQPSPDPDPDQP
ncbi:MAG: hypothetical protein H0W72_04415 [Planctomycetes bacterium]|nr:hypothetical protein [Planctomycetota bacterium]